MRDISEKQVAEYWNANAPVWIDQVGKGFKPGLLRELDLGNPGTTNPYRLSGISTKEGGATQECMGKGIGKLCRSFIGDQSANPIFSRAAQIGACAKR